MCFESCADSLKEERDLAGKMLLKFAAASADACCSHPSEIIMSKMESLGLFDLVHHKCCRSCRVLVCLLVVDTAMERHGTTALSNL